MQRVYERTTMERTDKPFGEVLTTLLAEREMSARELARRAGGMSPGGGTISHYTKGYINPDFEAIERVAHALEVPADYFAEHRLETIRRQLNWRAPRIEMPQGRSKTLRRALREARSLGLDV
jgi:transcriptional regulator with XRE-family HTH domain